MTNFTFNLPDKFLNKKSQIQGIINALRGDFNSTQTKDGTVYSIEFENEAIATNFKQKLEEIIPENYKY